MGKGGRGMGKYRKGKELQEKVQGNVLLMGHSFVRRVRDQLIRTDLSGKFSCGLGLDGCNVRIEAKGGGCIGDMLDLARKSIRQGFQPDCAVLQVGGNDCSRWEFDEDSFFRSVDELVEVLVESGVQKIVFMKLFVRRRIRDRRVSTELYRSRRARINFGLREMAGGQTPVMYISRSRLGGLHVLGSDGVHLQNWAWVRYYYALKWAAVRGLRSIFQ
jgi:hypothetical protein